MTKQKKITRSDKAEFAAFVAAATKAQRAEILAKEQAAGRSTYARITQEAIARLDR